MARGIRVGTPVRKGQVIGYVGRTGMATGPHLHYMMFKNGHYMNPFSMGGLADEQLSGERHARFARVRNDVTARLAQLKAPIDLQAVALAPRSVRDLIRSDLASYAN